MLWQQNVPGLKIQHLLDAFHCFIEQNHNGNKEQQKIIRIEWQKFKCVIEDDPFDIEGIKHYVENFKPNGDCYDLKLTKSVFDLGASTFMKRSTKKIVHNMDLQKISNNLLKIIKENNKALGFQ